MPNDKLGIKVANMVTVYVKLDKSCYYCVFVTNSLLIMTNFYLILWQLFV